MSRTQMAVCAKSETWIRTQANNCSFRLNMKFNNINRTIRWLQLHLVMLQLAFLLVLLIAHCVQLFGPLRLINDAIGILSMASSHAEGGGFLDDGARTVIPPAYPWLLSILLNAGIVSSACLVGLNLVFMIIGILCLPVVLRKLDVNRGQTLLVGCLTLCSWVVIKHVPIPLTDVPFLALSLSILALMETTRVTSSDRLATLGFLISWIAILLAISTRRIGVALLPALIWAIGSRIDWKKNYKNALVIGSLLLVGAAITLEWTRSTATLSDFPSESLVGGLKLLLNNIRFRMNEFGEITLNVPITKVSLWFHPLFALAGLASLVIIASGILGMFARRTVGPVEIYVISYFGIMFAWPYADSRFWIPILPIILSYYIIWFFHADNEWRIRCGIIFLCWFVFAGLGALAYSIRISVSGKQFPDLYGDGYLRSAYCIFLHGCPSDSVSAHDEKILKLLKTYTPGK
jgi:hypothetical protein